MPQVFGRNPPPPYEPPIDAWLKSGDTERSSMGRNVSHDHRVSAPRADAFDLLTNSPRTDTELRDAVVRYSQDYIKTSATPHFLDPTNANNIVSGAPFVRQVIHPKRELVRVLDFNGLTPVFQWARRNGHGTFASFPTLPDGAAQDAWLTRMIGQLPRGQFVSDSLDAMNDYRRHYPYHPTWATGWKSFAPYAGQGADRWLQVMGMSRPFAARWLILLRYTIAEAGTVARPTQLDAGWEPRHFPSPPQAPLRRGGHPVDLSAPSPSTPLLQEFIHDQIAHTTKHWTDAGGVIGRTSGPTTGSLHAQRLSHHHRLARWYGYGVYHWMPQCV